MLHIDSHHLLPSDEIIVNPSWPEDNREFFVYKTHQMNSVLQADTLVHGFYLMMPMDPRFLFLPEAQTVKMFVGSVYLGTDEGDQDDGSRNEVRIKVPAWRDGLTLVSRSDRASWEKKAEPALMGSIDTVSKNFKKGLDVPKDARFFKTFRLIFPEEYELSSKDVNKDAGDKEDIPAKIISVWMKSDKWSQSVLKHFVVFKVGRVDVEAFAPGAELDSPDKKGANADLLGDLEDDFAEMSTSA